jgi:hypothetical protein
MGSKKTIGIVLLVVGVIVLFLSLLANPIGIGNPSVFGRDQILGAIAGVILAGIGLVLTLRG